MTRPATAPLRLYLAAMAIGALVLAALPAGLALRASLPPQPGATRTLLLAPMIGVIEPCLLSGPAPREPALASACDGAGGSAAALVESTLRALAPRAPQQPAYALGYTLPVPLLQLFRRDGPDWAIDRSLAQRFARTVRDTDRPLILYLFSTHFAAGAPIEEELARDPANLAFTRDGPLGSDTYYGSTIYNWSFARIDNSLTARRTQAVQAVLDAVCALSPQHRAKIRGVSLLGELHHLFPDFQSGMGFQAPYRITDYSAASAEGFRHALQAQFVHIERLNRAVGSRYTSFAEVQPPSRDIRTQRLHRFEEHIDAYAHGVLPVTGWVFSNQPPSQGPAWVRIYRNGELAGRVPARRSRQDVLQALPQLGTADLGWQLDLDFSQWTPGLHRLDVMLERADGPPMQLGTRHIAVMDRRQGTPMPQPQRPLPATRALGEGVVGSLDAPAEQATYYFNPLVPLWHAFRAQQVVDYLQHFNALVAASCLHDTPRYTHQIVPFVNPGWDTTRYAIDASLEPQPRLHLGVSLYGEASYGHSFTDWFAHTSHRRYGITEFHPLKAMDAAALDAVFAHHAAQGAEFLSFFLEPRWHGRLVERGHNAFSFDPDNPQHGADALYRAVQQVLLTARAESVNRTLRPTPAAGPAHPSPTAAARP